MPEVDDIRWHVFSQRYPIRGKVGAGGQGQIFEFLCLVRRLREHAFVKRWTCWGAHIPSDAFEALATGESYPASMLRHHSEDPWWDDFADTSYRIDSESAAFRADLKSAVSSARVVANSYRDARNIAQVIARCWNGLFCLSTNKDECRIK
ncbi:hypothetical protein QN224_30195 [Sinorhizobium sp. 8-89]|uniref:hypothetical protein n=1 Tax=Sinorhizobium sp. 7-81 TaxID=3049087 RepID=UPI0024C46977|nr:hypothetical protein [Sinorhizobium sp. 7-81]MDK1389645.1 hypothetical protein [Sinorhizobium sp. 7-81]